MSFLFAFNSIKYTPFSRDENKLGLLKYLKKGLVGLNIVNSLDHLSDINRLAFAIPSLVSTSAEKVPCVFKDHILAVIFSIFIHCEASNSICSLGRSTVFSNFTSKTGNKICAFSSRNTLALACFPHLFSALLINNSKSSSFTPFILLAILQRTIANSTPSAISP